MLSKVEIAERDKLSDYIRSNIFHYRNNEPTPPYFWNRINALKCGEFALKESMENKKIYYSYSDILIVFIMCETEINNMCDRMTFKDENHKINTILKVIYSNMIPIMRMLDEQKEKDKKEEKIEDVNKFVTSKDTYIAEKENIDDSLEEFF